MKMLLTGGSGNLGQTLVPKLLYRGDTPVILDVRPPRHLKGGALFIEGSAVREGPKVCRLPAGGKWIRTLGPSSAGFMQRSISPPIAEHRGRLDS